MNLIRILANIVQFRHVPRARILHQAVRFSPQSNDVRRVRKVLLPGVLIDKILAPILRHVTHRRTQQRTPNHRRWRLDAGYFKESRGNVQVQRHRVNLARSGAEQRRAMRQQRHADRRLIHGALVNQSMFAPQKAVVAHVDHQRILQQLLCFQFREDLAHAFVNGDEALAVALVVNLPRLVAIDRAIHSMPRSPPCADPIGPLLVKFFLVRQRFRTRDGQAIEQLLMALGRLKRRMHRFVR